MFQEHQNIKRNAKVVANLVRQRAGVTKLRAVVMVAQHALHELAEITNIDGIIIRIHGIRDAIGLMIRQVDFQVMRVHHFGYEDVVVADASQRMSSGVDVLDLLRQEAGDLQQMLWRQINGLLQVARQRNVARRRANQARLRCSNLS